MKENNNDENVCYEKKKVMELCGEEAFRRVNVSKEFIF